MSARMNHWVHEKHRLPENIARYRNAIHESPAQAAILDDVLKPAKLSALRDMFERSGRFEPAFGLFNRHPHSSTEQEFVTAVPGEQFYHYHTLIGPQPGGLMSTGMVHNALFTMLSRSAEWRGWLADIIGQPLAVQTGMHARIMRRDNFMKRHNDDAHGSLCAVLYLNDGWKPSFGGCFVQELNGQRITEVAPLANRMLLFSPKKGLAHGVAPFTDPVGFWERWSYSLWYGNSTEGADPH